MIGNLFTHEFQATVQVTAQDSGGAIVKTYNELAGSPFKGFIEPLNGREILRNEKNEVDANHRLFCSAEIPIALSGQIIWDGKTFEIFAKNKYSDAISGGAHHQEIYLNYRA